MARINIEDCWWTDPRRERLGEKIGNACLADGAAIRMWRVAQEFWKNGRQPVPKRVFDSLQFASALLEVGLAELQDDGVYVSGSSQYLDWVAERRKAAAIGGQKSAVSRRNKRTLSQAKSKQKEANANQTQPSASASFSASGSFSDSGSGSAEVALVSKKPDPDAKAAPDGESPTAKTWQAYKQAYATRYGEPPSWNAKTAGQLKQFISRIPQVEAPDIAAFYLGHNNYYYVSKGHPVGVMLQDAEKLRTEWVTGKQITSADAKNADRKQGNLNVWAEIKAEMGK